MMRRAPGQGAEAASPFLPESDIPPLRAVADPYPTFNGVAVDPENNRVVMSDSNRKSVLVYDRGAGSQSLDITRPLRQIAGPATGIGFIAGVDLDPVRREIFVVDNDIEDRLVVFDYDARGNVKPRQKLYVPHQSWGVSLNRIRDEMAISVQQLSMVAVYRREAKGLEPPLRAIRGPNTGMADAHGVFWDAPHHEILVANHGNYAEITPYTPFDVEFSRTVGRGGEFRPPSLTVYAENSSGDARPLRIIQGPHTQLNWPMGIAVDAVHDEIAVANNGDGSVLIFRRAASGDAAPLRVLRGPATGIDGPMGVALDARHDELWVANYGDHTALVFPRAASGNATPMRILRNAPAETPTGGFGNPYAVAYDSKRQQLLVPN